MEGGLECGNCLKLIGQDKMDLHFSYCIRNIKKCVDCQIMFDVHYADDHLRQFHKKQKCQHCHLQFITALFQNHKKQCQPKFLHCSYCEMNVPELLYDEHVAKCGSRTSTCDFCKKQVILKDFLQHEVKCMENLSSKMDQKPKKQINAEENQDGIQGFQKGRKRIKLDPEAIKSITIDQTLSQKQKGKRSQDPHVPEETKKVRPQRSNKNKQENKQQISEEGNLLEIKSQKRNKSKKQRRQ